MIQSNPGATIGEIFELSVRVLTAYRNLPQFRGKDVYNLDPMILAEQLLHYAVKYDTLSLNHSILGMTSDVPCVYCLPGIGKDRKKILFDGKTIMIEEILKAQEASKGRLNFTIVHECSHIILMMMYPEEYGNKTAARCIYARNPTNKTEEERLADELTVRLLMPVDAIEYGMYTYGFKGKIRLSMGRELPDKDKQFVYSMMNYLGVSKTALLNRLIDLNYVEDMDADQYWEQDFFDECVRLNRRLEANHRKTKIERVNAITAYASGCRYVKVL